MSSRGPREPRCQVRELRCQVRDVKGQTPMSRSETPDVPPLQGSRGHPIPTQRCEPALWRVRPAQASGGTGAGLAGEPSVAELPSREA